VEFQNRAEEVVSMVSRPGKVIEVNPLTDPRWEALVASHRDGLIYHHLTWLHALALEQDREPLGLAYENDDCGRPGLPIPVVG